MKSSPISVPLIPAAEKRLTLKITCEECGCRMAVIGAGFFCPACGHNSADLMFDQAIVKCRAAIDAIPAIQEALADRDQKAQIKQLLIESQLANLVTAFSRFAEASYHRLPSATQTPRRNAFQNLTTGSGLWFTAGGREYSDMLTNDGVSELVKLFQQRHLIEHQQGIVDQDYLAKSGDGTYSIGQRIVIREDVVLSFAERLEQLVQDMRMDIASTRRSGERSS